MKAILKVGVFSSLISFFVGVIITYCAMAIFDSNNEKKWLNNAYKIVAKKPKDAFALAFLGSCLYRRGRYNDALAAYHKAIKIDGKCTAAYAGIGVYYAEIKNDYEEAFNWIKESMLIYNKEETEKLLKILWEKKQSSVGR